MSLWFMVLITIVNGIINPQTSLGGTTLYPNEWASELLQPIELVVTDEMVAMKNLKK